MQNGIQKFSLAGIFENDCGKLLSIQRFILIQDLFAEYFDNSSPCGCLWFNQFSCDLIGINNETSELGEHTCNR